MSELTSPVCVVDVETTGLQPYFHEIIQIAVVPLNPDYSRNEAVDPFLVTIAPEYFDRISEEALKVNGKSKSELHSATPRKTSIRMFMDWFKEVGFGNEWKLISPLAQNVPFDKTFLMAWLDPENKHPNALSSFFHYRWRDSMTAALFISDRARMHDEKSPFYSVSLNGLCKRLGITNAAAHTALGDAFATAEVYRKLCSM